jgi:hypothetical protein
MSLALQIAKMKRQGCRYCEHLKDENAGGEYVGMCEYCERPDTCGKWTVAKCMLPDKVTRVFPADVWEQVRDAIDSLLQLDVRVDAYSISSEQFDLLERWFICETPPKN